MIVDTFTLVPQSDPPASASEGEIYCDSDDGLIYYYNGTEWAVLGAGGGETTVGTKIVGFDAERADYLCDSTDDHIEIQTAIDDLGNTAGSSPGGAVYLLEGTYNLSSQILFDDGTSDTINDSQKSLIGCGAAAYLNGSTLKLENISNVLLSNLKGIPSSAGNTIYLTGVSNSIIDGLWAEKQGNSTGMYIYEENYYNIIVHNFLSGSRGLTAPDWGWASALDDFHHNIVSCNFLIPVPVSTGYNHAANARNNIFIGNHADAHNTFVFSGEDAGTFCENNIVVGNFLKSDNNNLTLWWISYTRNNIVSCNILYNMQIGICISPYLDAVAECYLVSSNIFRTDLGIHIIDSTKSLILGNMVVHNSDEGIEAGLLSPNVPTNMSFFSSNYLYNNGASGNSIYIYGSDNYLLGNFTGRSISGGTDITDSGTNTAYTDKVKITLEELPDYPQITSSNFTISLTRPTSYIRLTSSAAYDSHSTTAIADGKSKGDILILENAGAHNLTIEDNANTQLENNSAKPLTPKDVLTLVWNGTDWIETGYSDN